MWYNLSEPWKVAFLEGFEAFKRGSIPIGAAITDDMGNIISTGRNHIFENDTLNPKIAHAELDSLLKLDSSKYPNLTQYTMYACMEPCPMCFGAIVMGNLRKVKIAARDSFAGAVSLCETNPYIKSKNMQVEFECKSLEIVQLTLQSYFQIKRSGGKIDIIVEEFAKDSEKAVEIAKSFYSELYLDKCVENKVEFKYIFDEIINRI